MSQPLQRAGVFTIAMAVVTGCNEIGPSQPPADAGTDADVGCQTIWDGPDPEPLAAIGSYIALGDSISSEGDPPHFPELLRDDLEAKYETKLEFMNHSQGGARTNDVVTQVDQLPDTLPGPVVVTVTAGGNDLVQALPEAIAGDDGYERLKLRDAIRTVVDRLEAPGRFGEGVEVHVYWTDIYDPSDGAGDFTSFGCVIWATPPPYQSSDKYFCNWNYVIESQTAFEDGTPIDLHQLFDGHGVRAEEPWFNQDCVHPNVEGHDAIRRLMYEKITGETLP